MRLKIPTSELKIFLLLKMIIIIIIITNVCDESNHVDLKSVSNRIRRRTSWFIFYHHFPNNTQFFVWLCLFYIRNRCIGFLIITLNEFSIHGRFRFHRSVFRDYFVSLIINGTSRLLYIYFFIFIVRSLLL